MAAYKLAERPYITLYGARPQIRNHSLQLALIAPACLASKNANYALLNEHFI